MIFLIFPKLGVRLGLYSEREIENVRLVHLIFFIILSVLAVVFVSIKLKLYLLFKTSSGFSGIHSAMVLKRFDGR